MTLTVVEALELAIAAARELLHTARSASLLSGPDVGAHQDLLQRCQRALEEHREREMKDRQARDAIRAAAMQYRGQR